MIRSALALALVTTAASPVLAADAFQDTVALDHAVAAFAGHAIGEEGGPRAPIDARLKLKACPTVALSWRTDAHNAVVVACSFPAWRIFVPIQAPAAAPAVAAPAALAAAPPARAEPVIRRGDPVLIEANANGFSISREGVAMGDAAPGGRFLVKVDDAKSPVQAIAEADGRASLPGWSE